MQWNAGGSRVNSNAKGKRGERAVCQFLKEKLGIEARRSQQYCGVAGDCDVVGFEGVHIEVKFVEALNLGKAMDKALSECGDNVASVWHKRNRGDLMVTLRADDLERFVERFARAHMKALERTIAANVVEIGKAKLTV